MIRLIMGKASTMDCRNDSILDWSILRPGCSAERNECRAKHRSRHHIACHRDEAKDSEARVGATSTMKARHATYTSIANETTALVVNEATTPFVGALVLRH
jgi:hypothetical protein